MVIREFDTLPHILRPDWVEMTDFFTAASAGSGVHMGYGVFPPGMTAPPAVHQEDEYAFVLSCTQKMSGLAWLNHSNNPLLIAERIQFRLNDIIFILFPWYL